MKKRKAVKDLAEKKTTTEQEGEKHSSSTEQSFVIPPQTTSEQEGEKLSSGSGSEQSLPHGEFEPTSHQGEQLPNLVTSDGDSSVEEKTIIIPEAPVPGSGEDDSSDEEEIMPYLCQKCRRGFPLIGHLKRHKCSGKEPMDKDHSAKRPRLTLEEKNDYELKNVRAKAANKKILEELNLVKKQPLVSEDAIVVAKAWFPGSIASRLTFPTIKQEAIFLGFPTMEKQFTKPQAIAWFGQQLVLNKLVKLKTEAGLNRSDVIRL